MTTQTNELRRGARVMDAFIDSLEWREALDRATRWATAREARYVCFCNTHSVVTAMFKRDAGLALRESDLALPDGMPVAWMLRMQGFRRQPRINGPEFMWRLCSQLQRAGASVYLYGSQESTLDTLALNLAASFPGLRVAGCISPPFRRLTPDEDDAVIRTINESGASVVFVGLGCPKQEVWMAEHRGRLNAVIVGVGAAFDFHAGKQKRAAQWMQDYGLEWAYRLVCEPRRLWRRYLVTNSIFVFYAAAQLLHRALRPVIAPSRATSRNEP